METNLEHVLTNSYKADMIAYMRSHPDAFEELLRLSVSNKQVYSWRASWLLWSCMEENDKRVAGYINHIIDNLSTKNDNYLRELLIILQHMDLNDSNEAKVFNICMGVWESTTKKPSVRFNAFKMMVKIACRHPDLSQEILLLVQDRYTEFLSPAVIKSISLMIKKLVSDFRVNIK